MKHFVLILLLSLVLVIWTLGVFHEYGVGSYWDGSSNLADYAAALYAREIHWLLTGVIFYIALVVPILAHAICRNRPPAK